jgi:hypothetical protein
MREERSRRGLRIPIAIAIWTLLVCGAVSTVAVDTFQEVVLKPGTVLDNEYVRVWVYGHADWPPRVLGDCIGPAALRLSLPVQHPPAKPPEPFAFIADRVSASYLPADQLHRCQPFSDNLILDVVPKSPPVKSQFDDDAVKLDPTHNKVIFENDYVRVVRIRFAPGEAGPIVDKRARVIVPLTGSHASVTFPDGHNEPRDTEVGVIAFGNPGRQGTRNIGKTFVENIVVELKLMPPGPKGIEPPKVKP